jgi:hypothetical protein
MRNNGFALPIVFDWRIALGGYRWINGNGGKFLVPVDALKPDWPGLFRRYERTYRPLEEFSGLFRDFAALGPSQVEIRGFADQFGMLTEGEPLTGQDAGSDVVAAGGEQFEFWTKEIETLKSVVSLWDSTTSGDTQALIQLRKDATREKLPLAVMRDLHFDDKDPAMTSLAAIQRLTDQHLHENVGVDFKFLGNPAGLHVTLTPRNLLGALWLQFAIAVDALKSFVKCAHCGRPFEISRDPISGRRPDARFCSAGCRVAHYRKRKEQARRLRAAGMPTRKIALKLGSELKTVKGWLLAPENDAQIK